MVANRKLKLTATTSQHAALELGVFQDLLEVIGQREWRWLHADDASGGFITSDHPVCLFSNVPPKGLQALGYGMDGTTVYFPVSPSLALCGEFAGQTDNYKADAFAVGTFNRRMINHAYRQVYAANDKFLFFDHRDFFGIAELLASANGRVKTINGIPCSVTEAMMFQRSSRVSDHATPLARCDNCGSLRRSPDFGWTHCAGTSVSRCGGSVRVDTSRSVAAS